MLVRILAPIVPFTTDEAVSFAGSGTEFGPGSVHLEDWPVIPASWPTAEAIADVAAILRLRSKVNEALEPLRSGGKIGKSLDAAVTLSVPQGDPLWDILDRNTAALPELFIVSDVKVQPTAEPDEHFGVQARTCAELGHTRCPRCWRWVPALVEAPLAQTCPRCAEALGS
jgi:isoleucyl-tRNA synthetase